VPPLLSVAANASRFICPAPTMSKQDVPSDINNPSATQGPSFTESQQDAPPAFDQNMPPATVARTESYMMFVDNASDYDSPPSPGSAPPPPTYREANAASSSNSAQQRASQVAYPGPLPQVVHFFKGNGITSKARLVSLTSEDDGSSTSTEYRLVASLHKTSPSIIKLYSGTDTSRGNCLGTVNFSPTDNSFQMFTTGLEGNSDREARLVQVRARIGRPHPASYTFTVPAALDAPTKSGSGTRELVWTRIPSGYALADTTFHNRIAKWKLVQGEKHNAELKWEPGHPRSRLEEIVVVLSFVGSMSRLTLKGKDMSGFPNNGRWGAFWFMAVLGTATMADF
jgi:hypothetical protein